MTTTPKSTPQDGTIVGNNNNIGIAGLFDYPEGLKGWHSRTHQQVQAIRLSKKSCSITNNPLEQKASSSNSIMPKKTLKS